MFTQCPQCGSYFRVRTDHLRAAEGEVRCSLCTTTFNALSRLQHDLPDGETEATEKPAQATAPETQDLFESSGNDLETDTPARDDAGDIEDKQEPAVEETLPDWMAPEESSPQAPGRPLLWTFGCVTLLLLLGMQMIHLERDYWSEHGILGDPVSAAYEAIGQPVTVPRDLAALEIHRADIAGSSDRPGVLRLTAVVENTSDEAQPLPAIYVRLEDHWGMSRGQGFFQPEQWVHGTEVEDTIAAGARLALRLELLDPGDDAVGFHLEACWEEDGAYLCRHQRGGAASYRH
ncbi:zinc-ribbon and DUF3426 domain-containing protein [Gammaproteobacteria bacterium AB-CW1]|uniref:Zinc-ribbon and DUF3426 domain-containing protein n=1 Tax=Natronospira elongata TaxID=3110268 RepID=A0AAP6JFH8_9GAMM|nr:zinc-ribbon and DUF3426 domain-containing protein [Gammaproteobacteria bacterium AB-CW1]